MAALINSQLDFILFFYGLAFMLLGSTCFAISRAGGRDEPWMVLGLFGFAHGIGEWLDLSALIMGDALVFSAFRTALMAASFLLLLEFARREMARFGFPRVAKVLLWFYGPMILLVALAGILAGVTAANAAARYGIGFIAAMATSLVFIWYARAFSGGTQRLALFTAGEVALYGVAAGIIVPTALFWPANILNYDWFVQVTGVPIQLVRGVLASAISLSLGGIWGQQLILKVGSPQYTAYLKRQFVWTLAAMTIIINCGWLLTECLGVIYRDNIQAEARGDIDLLSSRLASETALVEGMVKALAGSPSVLPLFNGGSEGDMAEAKATLARDANAAGASLGMLFDKTGAIVASIGAVGVSESISDPRTAPFFVDAISGRAGYGFDFDPASQGRDFDASYPIRDAAGAIVGVAVLKKSIEALGFDLREFGRPYFFINPDGIVMLTNRPNLLFHALWPLSAAKQSGMVPRTGDLQAKPLAKREIVDATWTDIGGDHAYVQRRFVRDSQWSLVIIMPSREIFASRALGIVMTLLVAIMMLVYLFGRERWVRDTVEKDKNRKLQELARDLRFQATTDPLTGVSNRLKFDQMLAGEILRSDRYKTPLGLVLFDVDHFKDVNDTYGHPIGDKVLVELARFVTGRIRNTDLLARWGGEEFILLLPGSDGRMAYLTAEKLRQELSLIPFEGVGRVTCSFGVAQYADGDTAQAVISRADKALYRAKINGRNQGELASQPGVNQSLAY